MAIYLARNNVQAGPYSLIDFNQMVSEGKIEPTDLMWHKGMSSWQPVSERVTHQFPYAIDGDSTPTSTTATTVVGASDSVDNRLAQSAAPMTVSDAQAVDLLQTPAPLNDRILAKLFDLAWLMLPPVFILSSYLTPSDLKKLEQIQSAGFDSVSKQMEMVALFPTQSYVLAGLWLVAVLAIQGYLLARSGQSVGKRLMGLVVMPLQRLPTYDGALDFAPFNLKQTFVIRSLIFILLFVLTPVLNLVDTVFALFDSKHRMTLHDRLAKTIVVKKKRLDLSQRN